MNSFKPADRLSGKYGSFVLSLLVLITAFTFYGLSLFYTRISPAFALEDGISGKGKVLQDIPARERGKDQCIQCHDVLEGRLRDPVVGFEGDVHYQEGLSCSDCHGGDPAKEDMDEAMDPAKGYVGVPDPLKVPEFCSRCHGNPEYMKKYNPALPVDQVEKYNTSIHGKKLRRGDRKVAQCASCHEAHGIRKANDPMSSIYPLNIPETCSRCHSDPKYMQEYKIPIDQHSKFVQSVHGYALFEKRDVRGAPACNDCHGNHGAIPPGVESIAFVCGLCHSYNFELYEKSPISNYFTQLGLHGCQVCHGNHDVRKPTDEMVGVGKFSICITCHTKKDKGWNAAKEMGVLIDSLREKYESVEEVLKSAE
ncbi:MAG: cytochrome c3 family protein, partial [Fidelibacterota bacterium]